MVNEITDDGLCKAFRQIVTAGWANKSGGTVESPNGHFAMVTITEAELNELVEAVFDGDSSEYGTIEPGLYLVVEDSNGLVWLFSYETQGELDKDYARFETELAQWERGGKLYVVCANCGEAFDDLEAAWEHEGEFDSEPCYDDNHKPQYNLVPESEAL